MDIGLITTLLGIILTAIISQTVAVWVKFANLENKITESKCPFGKCPLYERARDEAVSQRSIENIQKGQGNG